MNAADILKLPMGEHADAGPTVGDYLKVTIKTFIREGEGFSGKRPLGNSDWDYQLAEALIKGGALTGHMSEWDEPEFEWDDYHILMDRVIDEIFV